MTDTHQKNTLRIAIFSDTHGNRKSMAEAVSENGPFDHLIHLGDGYEDGRVIAETFNIPFAGVYGNEDYGVETSETCLLQFYNWSFFLMHGHQFSINPYDPEPVKEKQYESISKSVLNAHDTDMLLVGHTHEEMILDINNLLILNPGSQYIGASTSPTFAVLKVSEDWVISSILQKNENSWQAVTGKCLFK